MTSNRTTRSAVQVLPLDMKPSFCYFTQHKQKDNNLLLHRNQTKLSTTPFALKKVLPVVLLILVTFFLMFYKDLIEKNNPESIVGSLVKTEKALLLPDWTGSFLTCKPNDRTYSSPMDTVPDTEEISFPGRKKIAQQIQGHQGANCIRLEKKIEGELKVFLSKYDFLNLIFPESSQKKMSYLDGSAENTQRGHGRTMSFAIDSQTALRHGKLEIFIEYDELPWFGPVQFAPALVTVSKTYLYETLPTRDFFHRSLPKIVIFSTAILLCILVIVLNHSAAFFWMSLYFATVALLSFFGLNYESSDSQGDFLQKLLSAAGILDGPNLSILSYSIYFLHALKVAFFIFFSENILKESRLKKLHIAILLSCLIVFFMYLPHAFSVFADPLIYVDFFSDALILLILLLFSGLFFWGKSGKLWLKSPFSMKIKSLGSPLFLVILFWTSGVVFQSYASIKDATSLIQENWVAGSGWLHLLPHFLYFCCALISSGSVLNHQNKLIEIFNIRLETLWQLACDEMSVKGFLAHFESMAVALKLSLPEFKQGTFELYFINASKHNLIQKYVLQETDDFRRSQFVFAENTESKFLTRSESPYLKGKQLILPIWIDSKWAGQIQMEFMHEEIIPEFFEKFERKFLETILKLNSLSLDKNNTINVLEEAKISQDDFLSQICHSIKTPLFGVTGICEQLQIANPNNHVLKKSLQEISNATKIALHSLSLQVEMLKFKADLTSESGKSLIRDQASLVIAGLSAEAKEKGYSILNDLDSNVTVALSSSVTQLLIFKAVKCLQYAYPVTNQIQLSSMCNASFVTISIDGTNTQQPTPGSHQSINEADLKRNDKATEQKLFLNQATESMFTDLVSWIEMMGGKTSLAANPPLESKFAFMLPIDSDTARTSNENLLSASKVDLEMSLLKPETPEIFDETIKSDAPTVWIFESDVLSLQLISHQLSDSSFNCKAFSNKVNLELELAMALPNLLVLCSTNSPEDVFSLLEKIRVKIGPDTLPVLLVTSSPRLFDLTSAFQVGANDVLSKPFSKKELLARVNSQLRLNLVTLSYRRFVPQKLLELLEKKDITNVNLGDRVQKEMAIIFMDIRGFTRLSEILEPGEIFDFLNQYFSTINPVVTKHNGFIDKYIGDAVLALFPKGSQDAIKASIEILKGLSEFNKNQRELEKPTIGLGFGIHYGSLILGTIGNTQRMEGTVISESVNLASRIEGLSKDWNIPLVASFETFHHCDPHLFRFRQLGKIRAKGISKSTEIVEILEGIEDDTLLKKIQTKALFENAVELFGKNDLTAALDSFEQVLRIDPKDGAAKFYSKRCLEFIQNPKKVAWDGVADLREK